MLCSRSASFTRIDADVVDHGEQHLADALGLALLARGEIELAQLGDAVDAAGDVVAEVLADFLERRGGVFHHVVQQAGFQAHHVHVHLGELARHQQRMDHVGLAGDALLALMALGGEAIGFFERSQVFVGAKLAQAGFQFAEKRFDRIGVFGDGLPGSRIRTASGVRRV